MGVNKIMRTHTYTLYCMLGKPLHLIGVSFMNCVMTHRSRLSIEYAQTCNWPTVTIEKMKPTIITIIMMMSIFSIRRILTVWWNPNYPFITIKKLCIYCNRHENELFQRKCLTSVLSARWILMNSQMVMSTTIMWMWSFVTICMSALVTKKRTIHALRNHNFREPFLWKMKSENINKTPGQKWPTSSNNMRKM